MTGLSYEPIISRRNRPETRERKLIRELKYWVAVLAAADVIYTALLIISIYMAITK